MILRDKMKHPVWIGVVFFFIGFSPGMWMPALPNVLKSMGHAQWIQWVYFGLPIGSIMTPFLIGSLTDGKIAANQLCGYVLMVGAVVMSLAFGLLFTELDIRWFVAIMFCNSILSAPLWGLVTQCALGYVSGEESRYPLFRVWGTVGWLSAGLIGGLLLNADSSPLAGLIGGLIRLPVAAFCFFMPHCEPLAKKKRFSILQMMSEGSRELWGNRNTRVLLISAGFISIPMSAYFMYSPLLMTGLGVENGLAWLTMSQWFEIPAIFTLAWASRKFRMKWLLGFGLLVTVFRQFSFMYAASTEQFWPMTLGFLTHGLTFSYFMTVAQMYMEKRVRPELRGRAQGMLSLMFGGVGGLIGVLTMGVLFRSVVNTETQEGWVTFWGVLGCLAALPTAYFYLRYQKRTL